MSYSLQSPSLNRKPLFSLPDAVGPNGRVDHFHSLGTLFCLGIFMTHSHGVSAHGAAAVHRILGFPILVSAAPDNAPLSFDFYQNFFVTTSCQLKRLEAASRSPIYSHISETFHGSSIIRAYSDQHRFILMNDFKVDENQRASFPTVVADRYKSESLVFRWDGDGGTTHYRQQRCTSTNQFYPHNKPVS